MTTKRPPRRSARKPAEKRRVLTTLARYEAEAKEIAAARQAMERLNKGVEFELQRLRYVTDLRQI